MRRSEDERARKKLFRVALVEELMDCTPAERARQIDQLADQRYAIPYSEKTTVSRSTIYRWFNEYQTLRGQDTMLMDKVRADRGRTRALTEAQQAALLSWRKENPYRTGEQLREELLAHPSTNGPSVPSESTITRFLRKNNLDRRTLLALWPDEQSHAKSQKVRLAFECEHPQQIWQMDTKGPDFSVIDPADATKTVVVRPLVILDDCARYVVGVRHVIEETEAAIMALVRSAIAEFGVPHVLYTDRGGPYMGSNLKDALRMLGCRIQRTPKSDPQAKGKVERLMRLITEHIEREIQAQGRPCTLEELHEITQAVIEQEYHRTVHSSLNETPEERYARLPADLRSFVSDRLLAVAFLASRTAKVSSVGAIRCLKQKYMVPYVTLYNKRVVIRYDPEELSKLYVWYDDQFFGEAFPYTSVNDYQKRQQLQERLSQTVGEQAHPTIPVPPFNRIARVLAEYRRERLQDNPTLNDELERLRQSMAAAKATLRGAQKEFAPSLDGLRPWNLGACTYLLNTLLRQTFSASQRHAIAVVWNTHGPFPEALVRKTVGEMLGNAHPPSDLYGFLDGLRIAAMISLKEEKPDEHTH